MGLLMLYGKGPLDFIVAGQKAWPRIFAWPLWDLWRSIEQLFSFHPAAFIAGNFPVRLLAGVLLVSAFLLLSIVSIFKIDKSYGIYSLILILFALANPAKEWQLYGDLRVILVVFPVFILLAQFGRRKLANVAIVVFSLFFLALFALYNGMGGWIS